MPSYRLIGDHGSPVETFTADDDEAAVGDCCSFG
jgi:hypothetical protein